jgi:glycosyltransferase involved in cell wall biosynthesis
LRHEVNGLIADNAEQFAEHTVRLWNDPALCRRLGDAARETVAGEFSSDRLSDALSKILENRGAGTEGRILGNKPSTRESE